MDRNRTLPWHESEFIAIDGLQCVYHRQVTGELVIHLHGCRSELLADLIHAGRKIVLPKRVREEAPPTRPKAEPVDDSPGRRREAALRQGAVPDELAAMFAQRLSAALDEIPPMNCAGELPGGTLETAGAY